MSHVRVRQRLALLVSFLILAVALLLWRAAYLSVGGENRNRTNLVLMTRTPHSLLQLEEQTKRIDQMSAHVEDYRLKDITELLSDTARLASYANREIKAQSDAWVEIKQSASVDARAYQELQQSLAATNQLQAQEISRLHDVLGEAERPSTFNSAVSLIATFFLGVVTSVLGDYLKKKFSSRILHAVRKVWAAVTGRRGISERPENGVKADGNRDGGS